MSITSRELETRLARIEKELAELKARIDPGERTPWYRQIVGDFAGDKAFREILRLGRRLRRGTKNG